MKNKALCLSLAAALFLASAPLWADNTVPVNPCTDPGPQSDPVAKNKYLTCLDEYARAQHDAILIHTKAAQSAWKTMHEYQLAPKEGGK